MQEIFFSFSIYKAIKKMHLYQLIQADRALHKTSTLQLDGFKNHSPPIIVLLRPALVCIGKYSISDICSLFIINSDQNTTAAEAIHKEAHIFDFAIMLIFVGMELVSTMPTEPTCSNVSNKRLFIFFYYFH